MLALLIFFFYLLNMISIRYRQISIKDKRQKIGLKSIVLSKDILGYIDLKKDRVRYCITLTRRS